MRLFFGIPIGPESRLKVDGFVQGIRKTAGREKISWVRPDLLHVTLRFLGEMPDYFLEKLSGWESRLSACPPIPVTIGPVGGFPNLDHPRVLHLHVRPVEPFLRLYQSLEFRLAELGLPAEDRPYVPHLTLARLRRPGARLAISPESFPPLSDTLNSVTLFQSRLTPAGPIHTPLSTALLRD